MERALRVLVIEDNPQDADLLIRELRRGYQVTWERVETSAAVRNAFDRGIWDVVISDYSLPALEAPAVLAIVKERGLNIPFIIVSGTIGEETAVAAMRAGAHDFFSKDRLTCLLPAIERELREAAGRAERNEMQQHLLISDRMASIGRLAAGVGHEINNPLAALVLSLDIAQREGQEVLQAAAAEGAPGKGVAAEGSRHLSGRIVEVLDALAGAMEAAERIRGIVHELRMYSHGENESLGPVELHGVIESALRMASIETRHRARVVKHYGDVPRVHANAARLGQVFLNLIVNAAQALPEGNADRNEIRITTRRDTDDRVFVEVRDTGSGIPAAFIGRIFDPFFTTKPPGAGTGLGLAICRRIVTSFGGEITVESDELRGTAFGMTLPATGAAPVTATPVPKPLVAGRRGRVLVVDDEPMVAEAIGLVLAREHEVAIVGRAREAADRITRGERFDVILCDLMMPAMTGMDLHAELKGVAAEQAERMIFMTGGAFTPSARQFLEQVANPTVEKPFNLPLLFALIRERVLR